MWRVQAGLLFPFLLLFLLPSLTLADCNDKAYAAATAGAPANIYSNFTAGVVVPAGSAVAFSCNASANDHLTPDAAGTGQLILQCAGASFAPPSPWPTCLRKCQAPQAPAQGYQTPAPALFAVGAVLQVNCSSANFYPGGNAPNISYALTCGANGTFPAASSWPACAAKCLAPTAAAGYADVNASAGHYFAVSAVAGYQCAAAHAYPAGVGPSNWYNLTCGANGTFPTAAWPPCTVMCAGPVAQSGYADPSANAGAYFSVGATLSYRCAATNFYPGGNTSSNGSYSFSCSANGTVTAAAAWPPCAAMCATPATPASGYATNASNSGQFFAVGASVSYYCAAANFYPGGNAPSNAYSLTCASSGSFPATTSWPSCMAKCLAPTPMAGYLDNNTNAGQYFSAGTSISYQCSGAGQLVAGTSSGSYSLACGANGTFPAAAWPACTVKCLVPSPETGFAAQTNTTPVAVGANLTYTCQSALATLDNAVDRQKNLTCGADGTFPKGWGNCTVKCQVPTPGAGFANQSANQAPVIAGNSLSFMCAMPGFTVGNTLKAQYTVICGANGQFPSTWPTCAMKCAVPQGQAGYKNQPAGTAPVDVGGNLTYTCLTPGQTVGTTLSSKLTIVCAANGSFPAAWPTCGVRCAVPDPEPDYDPQNDTTPVDVGVTLAYNCSDLGAKVGSSYSSQYVVTCGANGQFPTGWPGCSVRCVPPRGEPGYNSQPAGTPTAAVNDTLTYTCIDPAALVGTSASNAITIACDDDGDFPTGWPACTPRCVIPPAQGEYADLASSQLSAAVGERVTFYCRLANATVGATGSNAFVITCGANGTFLPAYWPMCAVPAACPAPPTPTNASGLVLASGTPAVVTSYQTVIYVCKNSTLVTDAGRTVGLACLISGHYAAMPAWPACRPAAACTASVPSPPAASGLGNSTTKNVSHEGDSVTYKCTMSNWTTGPSSGVNNFTATCGADGTFGTIAWPTCADPNAVIAPLTPAPCHCLGEAMTAVQAKTLRDVCRARVDVVRGDMTPPSRVRCGATSLANITDDGVCYCDSPLQESQTMFWYSLILQTEPWQWTEDDDGNSDLLQPTSDDYQTTKASIESSLDSAIAASPLGSGYVLSTAFRFKLGPAVPLGLFPPEKPTSAPVTTTMTTTKAGTGSTTTTAKAASGATATSTKSSTSTTTTKATTTTNVSAGKRRKRQASGYNYIQVDLATQFLNPGQPTQADFQALLDSLGGANGTVGTIVIDPNCDPLICSVRSFPEVCSNEFFESLPPSYSALTPFGWYISPTNASLVDAGNLLQIGEVAELSCNSTDPVKYPRVDDGDQDPDDHKLTVFCIPPDTPGQFGTWSLAKVPDCASVCRGYLADAPASTDLALSQVIPATDPTNPVNFTAYNNSDSYLMSGDKLLFECQTEMWGVYGGPDVVDVEFGCADDGEIDTPQVEAQWPTCSPQINMVITGVEMMLDSSDRALEDRYKLIDYKQEDFQKQIVNLENYFLQVTVPVMCALFICIAICCCCTRDGSPACRLCRSKVL